MTTSTGSKIPKSSFKRDSIQPFFSGGQIGICSQKGYMATPYGDEIVLTDFDTGHRIAKIPEDEEDIRFVTVTPSGSHLIACCRSLQIKTYSIPDCTLLKSTKASDSAALCLETDSTSTLFAAGFADGLVKVWDINGGFVTHNLRGHGSPVLAIKFFGLEGGKRFLLASGDEEGKIRLWNLVSRKVIAVKQSHVSAIRCLDFSQDGKFLISGGGDNVLNVWGTTKEFKLLKTIPVLESLLSLGFLPPGTLQTGNKESHSRKQQNIAFTAGELNRIRLWDVEAGKEVTNSPEEGSVQTDEEVVITQVLICQGQDNSEGDASEPSLLAVHSDHTLIQHSLISRSLPITRRIAGFFGEILDLVLFGPDESHIAIAESSAEIRLLSRDRFGFNVLEGHTNMVISLAKSIDGNWLASGGKDATAKLWHIDPENESFKCHSTFIGHADQVSALSLPGAPNFNPGGLPAFLLTGSEDLTIKKWTLSKTTSSEDGEQIINKAVFTRKSHDAAINAISVAPNNETFATASSDKTAKIWETDSGNVIAMLQGHRRTVWSVIYSQYDKVIATGSRDGTVKLWSLDDYSCLKTFQGHTGPVLKVLFITSGLQLATAGGDGLVKIWTIKTEECSATLDNHEGRIWALASREDDTGLVSGGEDSVITFWTDNTEQAIKEEAEKNAEMVEKEQNLSNYMHRQDWRNAIILAMSLDQPHRLLNLFKKVIDENKEPESHSGLLAVDEVLSSLSPEQLSTILSRIRDWNTNAKTSVVAQRVLHTLLVSYPPNAFVNLPNIKPVLDATLPYSRRHYNRIEGLLEDSYVVDFSLRQMEQLLQQMDNTDSTKA